MQKRDIVKATINHVDTGIVPYHIGFTPGAAEKISPFVCIDDISINVGNFIYDLVCPWWSWYNIPESYAFFDSPDFLPAVRGRGSYEEFGAKIQKIKDSGCYILVTIYGSHFERAYFARGIENFLADLAAHPDFAKKLLDKIISRNLVMIENILSYVEIDGILLGSDWGSQNSLLMSPDTWRELIAPGEAKEYSLIKGSGKDLWIHSCGNIEQIIPDLIDMGVDVLNPVQPEAMDIFRLKAKFGSQITFWGGISTQTVLPHGNPEEVKNEVDRVVKVMSKGGGYILSPSQIIQEDVPVENVLAFIDRAMHHAKL